MSQNRSDFLQIMALMAIGIASAGNKAGMAGDDIPPTPSERTKAGSALKAKEGELKKTTNEFDDNTKLRANLDKSVEALEKTYGSLSKESDEMAEQAKKRVEEAAKADDETAKKSAKLLQQRATALQEESAKMKATLDKLKDIQKQAKDDVERGGREVNRLKRELQDVLAEYFKTADPKMIAERYGLPFDGNVSFDVNAEFMKLTKGGDAKVWMRHFGIAAEHTWEDSYTTLTPKGFQTISLKPMAQHEQVTSKVMFDTATALLQKKIPGISAPVARFGVTVTDDELKKYPEPYKAVFGHPVDAFRPSVVNNSTRSSFSLEKPEYFREMMDLYTRGAGTKTIKSDNGSITYGLPPMGRPILSSASGNNNWGYAPDPSMSKNFYPNLFIVGTSEIPSLSDTNVSDSKNRNDKAPPHIESYSTQHSGVFATIRRPRWNADGTPIKVQYLNPDHANIIEENLWRLTGKPVPTAADLDDESKYPRALVQALQADKKMFTDLVRKNEGTDEVGFNSNLKGTSFSAPTASGVLLAARILFPDASAPEIIDAFCSSCAPITHRQLPDKSNIFEHHPRETVDDVNYLVNEKTGRIYSPMAGFGEFVIDDKATKDKPDSWMKMLERLEQMKQERSKLTRGGKVKQTVEVGEGPNKREVVITGQPLQATLELTKGKEIITDASKKHVSEMEELVMNAFQAVERNNDASIVLDDSYPIYKMIKKHEYSNALKALKTDHKYIGETDPYLKEAEAAVEKALKMEEHAYEFEVRPDQDLCTTIASMRLQFKNKSDPTSDAVKLISSLMGPTKGQYEVDPYIVLESPEGMRIPIILSDDNDGISVATTPGFMRQSTVGTWKIYTRRALDIEKSSLVLSGTERNVDAGIVDVREKVLTEIEKKEARHRKLDSKNIMEPVKDPHETIRNMIEEGFKAPKDKKKKTSDVSPSTRDRFQRYMEDFIKESELKKGGFIPKGHIDKVSMSESHLHDRAVLDHALSTMTALLGDLHREVGGNESIIHDAWGYLAAAIVNQKDIEAEQQVAVDAEIDSPVRKPRAKMVPDGVGYLALLESHKGDVPPWWHENQRSQVEAARRPSARVGRG